MLMKKRPVGRPKSDQKQETFLARLPKKYQEPLQDLAVDEVRSMAGVLTVMIQEGFEKRGRDPETGLKKRK